MDATPDSWRTRKPSSWYIDFSSYWLPFGPDWYMALELQSLNGCGLLDTRIQISLLAIVVLLCTVFILAPCGAGEDTDGPPVEVNTPIWGSKTNASFTDVQGFTTPFLRVNLTVWGGLSMDEDRKRDYTTLAEEDGAFMSTVHLFEGIQRICVNVTDPSGNSTEVWLDILLDTKPPKCVMDQPEEAVTWTKESTYRIMGTGLGECMKDIYINGEEVLYTGTFEKTVDLEEGPNHFLIEAFDGAMNRWAVEITIIRDSQPPEMDLADIEGDEHITNNNVVTLSGSVMDADGPIVIEYNGREDYATLEQGDWEEGLWTYDLELDPTDGEHVVIVKSFDHVTNEANITITVVLDTVRPPIQIDNRWWGTNQNTIYINGTTEETIDTIWVNEVPEVVYQGVFSVYFTLVEGNNSVRLRVMDEAGNENETEMTIVRDTATPSLKIDASQRVSNDWVYLEGTTDPDVAYITVQGERHFIINGTFRIDVDLEKGENRFLIEVTDVNGNYASKVVTVMYVDVTNYYLIVIVSLAIGCGLLGYLVYRKRNQDRA